MLATRLAAFMNRERVMRKLLWCVGLVVLVGCQSSPTPVELTAEQHFVKTMQRTLSRMAVAANDDLLVGAVNMELTLDSQGELTRCAARPVNSPDPKLPAYNERLGHQLANACWGLILPLVPKELRNEEPDTELVAPLFLMPQDPERMRNPRLSSMLLKRDHYLWHRIFSDLPIDSIGRATFWITPDEYGRTQTCEVVLKPHSNRPDGYRADRSLRHALEAGCARLNPQEMPYQQLHRPASRYSVAVDYAPWKKHLQSR